MSNSTTISPVPRPIKSLCSSGQPNGGHGASAGREGIEPHSAYGPSIAQMALQSIGMSTKDPWGPPKHFPDYALALSLIFTKATNQTIILGTPPNHVLSTSILWSFLAHDKRFQQVPMSEAAPGDIIIGSGWQQGADGYAGIVVNHERIVSNSDQGVQNNSSLTELERSHPGMAAFRYVGFWNYYRSKSLANAGLNADEPRPPAGQPGGGQWTSGGAGTEASSEGWFSALKSKLKDLARILQDKQNCLDPAGTGTNGSAPLGDELAMQIAQMSPAESEQFIKGYKQGVKEALPVIAPFVPVASQIQSVATLTDPKASTIDKVTAAVGIIPEIGGIVKELGAGAKAVKAVEGGVKTEGEISKAVQEGAQVARDAEKEAEIAKAGSAERGSANQNTKNAASLGTSLHSDKPGNLPDQLRDKYPDTNLEFTKPGVSGQDVKAAGGKHPSEYPASDWRPEADHGDFKPDTPGGARTFKRDQQTKWTEPTQKLPYDPKTRQLR